MYPSALRRDSSFDRSALFFDNFCPTGAAVKSILLVVPVVDVPVVVDVVDVVDVPVDDVVVEAVLPVFLDFTDFVADVSALASLVSAFVVCFVEWTFTGFAEVPVTGFAEVPLALGPCVVVVVFGPWLSELPF